MVTKYHIFEDDAEQCRGHIANKRIIKQWKKLIKVTGHLLSGNCELKVNGRLSVPIADQCRPADELLYQEILSIHPLKQLPREDC